MGTLIHTMRVALLETKTIDNGQTVTNPVTAVRYQYDNHLGSACLELDENAGIVSYEEYHPFGTTSYRAGRTSTEVSLKCYKYVGKERDEETGLYYYGMRYYADWLCRFVSVDPLQFKYPHYTPFQYAGNKPVSFIDLDGGEEKPFIINNDSFVKTLEKTQQYRPEADATYLERKKTTTPVPQKTTTTSSALNQQSKGNDNQSGSDYHFNFTSAVINTGANVVSNSSTAASTALVAQKGIQSRYVMASAGRFLNKFNDYRVDFASQKMLDNPIIGERKLIPLKEEFQIRGNSIRTNDIISQGTKEINIASTGLTIVSSIIESGMYYCQDTLSNPTERRLNALWVGALSYSFNANPAVSVVFNFGKAVSNTEESKMDRLNMYKEAMSQYKYNNGILFKKAESEYFKMAIELDAIPQSTIPVIKQSDHN